MSATKKTQSKKKKGKTKPRSAPRSDKSSPFPGIPSVSSMDQQRPITHRDPTVASVVAQFSPFRVPRGVTNILAKTLPSQKFTARSVFSLSPGANIETIISVSPCIASDTGARSTAAYTGTRANLNLQAMNATTGVAGVSVVHSNTNTPYAMSTLGGNDFQWRLVSCGVRIRNTTAAVNRQGVIKTIVDIKGVLVDYRTPTTSLGAVCDAMDANHRVVRRNMSTHPEFDLTLSGQLSNWNVDWRSSVDTALSTSMGTDPWSIGLSDVMQFGSSYHSFGPGWVLLPSVATAQTYDIEVIEHWEIHGTAIETLHTPSGGHIGSADLVHTIVAQAHHQHALTPSAALADVAKGVSFAEHHKAAIKDCASVAAALALI